MVMRRHVACVAVPAAKGAAAPLRRVAHPAAVEAAPLGASSFGDVALCVGDVDEGPDGHACLLACSSSSRRSCLLRSEVLPVAWASWYLRHSFAEKDLLKGTYKDMGPEEGEIDFLGFSPIHTVIMGHCGTHTESNLAAFEALGIRGSGLKALMFDLSVLAATNLRTCRRSFELISKASARGIG